MATAVAERIAGARVVAVLARPTERDGAGGARGLIAGSPWCRCRRIRGLGRSGTSSRLRRAGVARDGADGATLPVVPVRRYAKSWHRHPEPPADHAAFILYTSGTTGLPKGVPITRRAIAAGLDALADAWRWTTDDVLAQGLPLFHVHGLILGILGPLRRGSSVIHTGSPRLLYTPVPPLWCDDVLRVPTVWSRVAADTAAAQALSSSRLLISGAPLPVPTFDAIRSLTGHQIVERYGMTETLITVSTRSDGERRPGWVGLPLTGVETRLREGGNPTFRDGESVGDLLVQGPMVGTRYLNRPEATAESWIGDGWFATGDVAVIDGSGMHRIVGRRSTDLIKSEASASGPGDRNRSPRA